MQKIYKRYWKILRKSFWYLALLIATSPIFAVTTDNLPWDTPAQKIESWLTGSIAKTIAVALIAISGISYALGEHGSSFRRWMGIVFGISIAIGATSIYLSLGFSGATV